MDISLTILYFFEFNSVLLLTPSSVQPLGGSVESLVDAARAERAALAQRSGSFAAFAERRLRAADKKGVNANNLSDTNASASRPPQFTMPVDLKKMTTTTTKTTKTTTTVDDATTTKSNQQKQSTNSLQTKSKKNSSNKTKNKSNYDNEESSNHHIDNNTAADESQKETNKSKTPKVVVGSAGGKFAPIVSRRKKK